MGNRAVITFAKKPTSRSLGIYLHWNGGPESVLAFLEAANYFQVREGDDAYELARMVQIIGNYFGGTTSIGVGVLRSLDCDNGDNGVYCAGRSKGVITIRRSRDGKTGWKDLDNVQIKKHAYWKDNQILIDVIAANTAAFSEQK
jgi:hypothetical protein